MRPLAATLVLALSTAVCANDWDASQSIETASRHILLRSTQVDTTRSANLATADEVTIDSEQHYLLQLDGPMTDARRATLRAAGLELRDYLPVNAWLVAGSTLSQTDLKSLPFVVWAGPYEEAYKLDPEVGAKLAPYQTAERIELEASGRMAVVITLFRDSNVDVFVDGLKAASARDVRMHEVDGQGLIYAVIAEDGLGRLLGDSAVQYVEDAPEVTLRNSTTRWIVQSNMPNVTPLYDNGLHGEGQIVGVLDSNLDQDHCSFVDNVPIGPEHRKIIAYNADAAAFSHGTHVSGTVAGDDGTDGDLRGVAYAAKIAYARTPAFNESAAHAALTLHHSQGARLHTNSWGDDTTTAYNSLCRGFDVFLYENEESLACLAVTNGSVLRNPENAKNLLAVGASRDTPSQESHCSGGVGPTSDGRRKPEVYAPGCLTTSAASNTTCGTRSTTGTSMACPAVAGVGVLVRQYFTDGYYPTGAPVPDDGFVPSGALLKAVLVNASVDMTGIAGYPSNLEGWGRLIADNALYFPGDTRTLVIEDVRNSDGLTTGDSIESALEVVTSAEPLHITLTWTEPAATSGAAFAQVNDLDLEVIAPSGDIFRGNAFADGASIADGGRDDRNNVEQVVVPNPEVGEWSIQIRATAVNVGRQGYASVISGDVLPQLPALTIALPNSAPTLIAPNEPTTFAVRVRAGTEQIVPGSPMVHYRAREGDPFAIVPLAPLGGEDYQALLPAFGCNDTPQFFVTADGDGGTRRTSPRNAPESTYSAEVGEIVTLFADDFEIDQGWQVMDAPGLSAGSWTRGIPAGGGDRGDPASDFDGSGACFLTDNVDGNSDIDDGTTELISPPIDLAGGDAEVQVAVWYSNSTGADPNNDLFTVHVSNNNGLDWILVETLGPAASGGWQTLGFRVSDFVIPNANVQVRFVASDLNSPSVVEAAIDGFEVKRFECRGNKILLGDMNCDGTISVGDINPFVLALTDPAAYEVLFPDCSVSAADCNQDRMLTVGDINCFVALVTGE